MTPYLSIIIPARDDAAALGGTLDELDRHREAGAVEVIVAACGDRAGTARAAAGRARLLWPRACTRAALMNAAAAAARGEVLLFLHADSSLPPEGVALIRRALADLRVVGGAFEQRFTEDHWSLRAIARINRIRYRLTGNYYGDQGIFVRAAVFRRMGGFQALAILEDLDFAQRLQRMGRSVLVPVPLHTSGRRFLARGPWRTLAFMSWLLLLRTLGLDAERYAQRYHGPADRSLGDPCRTVPQAGAQSVRR